MNWDDARIFLAVAREGQLLAAARRLGVNHATVGRRLTALEASLGTKLVERRPVGCALTEEGEVFRERAERIEAEWHAAQGAVGPVGALAGRVRIGAPDGFGTAFLAPRLGALLELHPELSLDLVPVSQAFSLARREADIAVAIDRPEEGRLVSRKLVDYRLGLYAATAYLERAGRPADLSDLSRHRLIGPVEDLVHSRSIAYAADLDTSWPTRLGVSSALGQTEAAVAGAGIAILHDFIAAGRMGLERVLPGESIQRTYWLVMHETSRHIPRVRAVSEYVAEIVRSERHIF
jgi:DNA-binding transcriptional LysR family regulator